jgi:regulator of sigma E protease
MSFLGIIAIIFAFSLLVLIHELGHFLAARWMGVRVEKFSIGFPPTLFSKKIGDTEFSISAIPLGGYVKMAGFIDESMDSEISGAEDEYSSKPVWKRFIIISAGVIMNLFLAMGLYSFINYSQGEVISPVTTLKVDGESGIAQKIGFQDGDKILKINDEEIHQWRDVFRNFFTNIENDFAFEVLRGDKKIELQYQQEWLAEENGELLNISRLYTAKLGDISPGDPASITGLQFGDEITELNGHSVSNWDEMTEIIRSNADNKITVKWKRGNKIIDGFITPKKINITDEKGLDSSFGRIGVLPHYIQKPISLFSALKKGIVQPFELIYMNMIGLKWLITGVKSAKETIGGPVMIAKLLNDSAERGWIYYVSFIAMLSSVLAFFNTLPIPALDGGHLAFLLVEAVMGRPLSLKTRLVIQQVGMALLLSLIVFVLYIDFDRLF